MFWVNDSMAARHKRIRAFRHSRDLPISVILAAADFEWTVRRAIIALGYRPNAVIRRDSLGRNCSNVKAYKAAWIKEVVPLRRKRLPIIIKGWRYFSQDAFHVRHRLVHGVQTPPTGDTMTKAREAVLGASQDLVGYADNCGFDLYSRLPVRRKEGPLP